MGNGGFSIVGCWKKRARGGQVPGLISMEAGADFMGSPRSFDLALVATLEDRAALDVYADHPAHVAVKEYLHPFLEKGISVDFEVE